VATTTAEFVENYNCLFGNGGNYSNVTPGANTLTYPPIFTVPLLKAGHRLPAHELGELNAKWSQIGRIAGTSMSTDDLFGMTRPTTDSKKSLGAIQATGAIKEITVVDGQGASLKLPDAGQQFLMRAPIPNSQITVGMKVYRETTYSGSNPAMLIRQPGQSDRITTDTGNAINWNQLQDTFTPASSPPYIDIFAVSQNVATISGYAYFDTVTIT
jgi:hypothetical protein